jgi:glutamate-5-semialdehyde dehydrogenase
VVETQQHAGWRLDRVVDGLGVVGFVFEGRPNVFADATGILRGGNTAVMRIGSDALGTARAIDERALRPALAAAGLPEEAIVLLDSPSHAAAWALFAHPGLSLAVARGSGPAVAQLGAIARQTGTPVSLHGTGGAWIVADETADGERFRAVIYHSLDRKVCNTVNTVCIVRSRAAALVPLLLAALEERIPPAAGQAGGAPPGFKLHVAPAALPYVPSELFSRRATIMRAEGPVEEAVAQPLPAGMLGREWEWERSPEVTLTVVESAAEAVALFNAQSPLFIASLISEDPAAHDAFFRAIDAPFVGDGFTRWVDGQYALLRPELGLSNWQNGRLFARGGILSGDGVYTVRYRVHQVDPHVHR